MAITRMSSREFNHDTGSAKKAARKGPVYVTDRGRVSHVLLSIEDFQRLAGGEASIIDLLAGPPGVEDIGLDLPAAREVARPALFD